MTHRFFCCWATAVLAGLIAPPDLPLAAPNAWTEGGASMDTSSGSGTSSLTPIVAVPSATDRSQKQDLRKQRRTLTPFVLLAQRITEEALLCGETVEVGDETISTHGIDCLTQEPGLRWAFSRPSWNVSGRWEELAADNPNQRLRLTPLNIAFGPYSPWFTMDFAPLSGEEQLFDHLELMGNEASRVAANLSETSPDRHAPPFAYHLGLNRQSSLIAGLGWIDDVSDTTGMKSAFARAGVNEPTGTVGAINLILGASIDAFTLTGGYLHAVDRKSELDNTEAEGNIDPTAWNSELAYRTHLLDRKTTLAVGYQKSSDSLSRYFPDERYTTRASILLFDATTLSLEYYQDRHDATDNNLDGSEAYGITTKFGFDF